MRYGSDAQKIVYTYDALGRITARNQNNGNASSAITETTYTYSAGSYTVSGYTCTTPLVTSIAHDNHSTENVTIQYEYATNSTNITKETRIGSYFPGERTYEYDTLGQLTRVNNPTDKASGATGTTWVYEYDRGGNILNKKRYAYTTGALGTPLETITYTYGDSVWKDKLTGYNGATLTYDAIGNLTGDGTYTYTWQAGRQLAEMTSADKTITYEYDHNGLRVRKTVNGVVTNYTYNGRTLVHLSQGTNELHFYYDAQGRPAAVDYNGTMDQLYLALLIYTGERRGEVLGLKWGDIDLDANVIHIKCGITYPAGANDGIISAPKQRAVIEISR